MTILVDRPRWHWRGERWAHLISDTDPVELHSFAATIGLRRLAFQGDHYDLPESLMGSALAAGARAVDSRLLVRRLRQAGLRRRGSMGWEAKLHWEAGSRPLEPAVLTATGLPADPATELAGLAARPTALAVIVLHRTGEWGMGWTGREPGPGLVEPPRRWATRRDDTHHLDWFVLAPDRPGVDEASNRHR